MFNMLLLHDRWVSPPRILDEFGCSIRSAVGCVEFLLTKVLAIEIDSENSESVLGAIKHEYSRPGIPPERAYVGLIVSER